MAADPIGAAGALWHPSPNFGPRRDGLQPALVILHYTAMASAEAALERLCDPAFEVSAHYLIGADGTLWQLVDERARAWHAGAGSWQGRGDVNSRSIGIELDNDGASPFAEPLMTQLEALLADLLPRWDIPPMGVLGHQEIAPERKADPGRRFDWARLADKGLALPSPPAAPVARPRPFHETMAEAGYPAEADEAALLEALRARHRPGAHGPLAPEDHGLAQALASIAFDRPDRVG